MTRRSPMWESVFFFYIRAILRPMSRTLISDLHGSIGQQVSVSGWIDIRRDQGKMVFFDIRDRSGKVQSVVLPSHTEALEAAKEIRPEWVVTIDAQVNKRPERNVNAKDVNGDIELEVLSISVLSKAQELPFEKEADVNLDTYLDNLPFTLRTKRARTIFQVQSTLVETYRESLRKQGFTEFQSPSLVGGDAEGGSEVFKVDYFNGRNAYLASSPQFYKQIMVGVFERGFAVNRAFRAEKHSTTRHLNEYCSLDFEMGFIKDHTTVMAMLEGVMKSLVGEVGKRHTDAFQDLGIELPIIAETIPVMKLREAQALITKETGEDCTNEPDLEPSHERWLCEYASKNLGSDFIYITHYPVSKRPFYTYEDENDKGFTKSFDLLFRGVEIVTGGQRIHNYDTLIEKIKGKGLVPEKFSYYLQAFKYGMPPHGGCAIGLERLTQKFLNLENVKEATLFPRDLNRIDTLLSQ